MAETFLVEVYEELAQNEGAASFLENYIHDDSVPVHLLQTQLRFVTPAIAKDLSSAQAESSFGAHLDLLRALAISIEALTMDELNLAVEGGLTESCVGLAGTLAVTASLAQRDALDEATGLLKAHSYVIKLAGSRTERASVICNYIVEQGVHMKALDLLDFDHDDLQCAVAELQAIIHFGIGGKGLSFATASSREIARSSGVPKSIIQSERRLHFTSVLISLLNEDDDCRLESSFLILSFLSSPQGRGAFYSNDIRVAVDVIVRVLIDIADDCDNLVPSPQSRKAAHGTPALNRESRQRLQVFLRLLGIIVVKYPSDVWQKHKAAIASFLADAKENDRWDPMSRSVAESFLERCGDLLEAS